MHSFLADREVSLVSLDFTAAISDLYEDVSLEAIQKIGSDQQATEENSSC